MCNDRERLSIRSVQQTFTRWQRRVCLGPRGAQQPQEGIVTQVRLCLLGLAERKSYSSFKIGVL